MHVARELCGWPPLAYSIINFMY